MFQLELFIFFDMLIKFFFIISLALFFIKVNCVGIFFPLDQFRVGLVFLYDTFYDFFFFSFNFDLVLIRMDLIINLLTNLQSLVHLVLYFLVRNFQ